MDFREQVEALLADFARETGKELMPDEAGGVSFVMDNTVFNLVLLPKSEQLLLWTWVGDLGRDGNAPRRARRLLELNDGFEGSHGGTFMVDPEREIVMLADRRGLATVGDPDRFAAWIDALHTAADAAWAELEYDFPFVDDEPLEASEPLVRKLDGKEVR